MTTLFNYTISSAFPSGKVDSDLLVSEILAGTFAPTLERVEVDQAGDSALVEFDVDLSGAEETELAGIVAAHDGRRTTAFFYGESGDYIGEVRPVADEIQYVSVEVPAGSYGRIWILPTRATGSPIVYAAIYSVAVDGKPLAKLQEGSRTLGVSDEYVKTPITVSSPVVLTSAGRLAIAVQVGIPQPRFAGTQGGIPGLHPFWFEDGTLGSLPSSPTVVTKMSPIMWAAITE